MNKMFSVRLFPIVCQNCGIHLYPISYFRPVIHLLGIFLIPVAALWGAGKWDSWLPALVYIGLVIMIDSVWKALSPLKERST